MDKEQWKRVKFKLLEIGKSQRELAKELGISEYYLSNLIAGRRKPTKKFAEWIKRNLEVLNSSEDKKNVA